MQRKLYCMEKVLNVRRGQKLHANAFYLQNLDMKLIPNQRIIAVKKICIYGKLYHTAQNI